VTATIAIANREDHWAAVDSLVFREFAHDAVPGLNLQRKRPLELLKQHLGLKRVAAPPLEFEHKVQLRLDGLLTFQNVLAGKLEMVAGDIAVDY
jgi:hypothetical protein